MVRNPKTLLLLAAVLLSQLASQPLQAKVERLDDCYLGAKLKIPVYQWQDTNVPRKAIVVGVHGLTFYAEAFDDFARCLAGQGYEFIAADIRGFGRWKTESEKYAGDGRVHYTEGESDLLNLLRTVRTENPATKIFILGESLGANEALWVTEVSPDLVDGAVLGSPCVKWYVHPRVRWIPDFLTGITHPKSPLNMEPYINPYLSTDRSLTESCLQDPKICRSMTPAELIKSDLTLRRPLKLVAQIPKDMPILMVAGEKDAVFRTDALPKFAATIKSRKLSLVIMKDRGHLMIEHQPIQQDVVDVILKWLDSQGDSKQEIVRLP